VSFFNSIPAVSGRIVGLFQNTCLFLSSFGLPSGFVEMLDEDFCEIAWKNLSYGTSETGVAGSKIKKGTRIENVILQKIFLNFSIYQR